MSGLFFVIAGIAAVSIAAKATTKKNSNFYAGSVLAPMLKERYPNVIIQWTQQGYGNGYNINLYEIACKFFKARVISEDISIDSSCYISGNSAEQDFEFMNLHTYHGSGNSSKSKNDTDSFRGQVYRIKCPFKVDGTIRIVPTRMQSLWKEIVNGTQGDQPIAGAIGKLTNENKVEIPNAEFEEVYDVYATNPEGVAEKFNWSVIQTLNSLEANTDIAVTLKGDEAYLAVWNDEELFALPNTIGNMKKIEESLRESMYKMEKTLNRFAEVLRYV